MDKQNDSGHYSKYLHACSFQSTFKLTPCSLTQPQWRRNHEGSGGLHLIVVVKVFCTPSNFSGMGVKKLREKCAEHVHT